ncbi:MAG: nucleotide exchange factor GrpE [Actinomycetota bacterium]
MTEDPRTIEDSAPEVAGETAHVEVPPDAPAPDAPLPDRGEGGDEPAADASKEPAGDDAARPLEVDIDELLAKARERDEYLALAQRTQADFENFRKRKAREVSDAEGRGVAKLVKELLPALDALELALEHLPEEAAGGLRPVQAQLAAALTRVGVESFSPQGEPFDPNEHEAMMQTGEGEGDPHVAEIFRQGYKLRGSVIRPASVRVERA